MVNVHRKRLYSKQETKCIAMITSGMAISACFRSVLCEGSCHCIFLAKFTCRNVCEFTKDASSLFSSTLVRHHKGCYYFTVWFVLMTGDVLCRAGACVSFIEICDVVSIVTSEVSAQSWPTHHSCERSTIDWGGFQFTPRAPPSPLTVCEARARVCECKHIRVEVCLPYCRLYCRPAVAKTVVFFQYIVRHIVITTCYGMIDWVFMARQRSFCANHKVNH